MKATLELAPRVRLPDSMASLPRAALGAPLAAGSAAKSPLPPGVLGFSHAGAQHLLGYGKDFYAIWDRKAPATILKRFPRNPDGWTKAFQAYSELELDNDWGPDDPSF
jgi:hypothetical protein